MNQSMKTEHEHSNLPWYRYGMMWLVIALPLLVVAASMVTIYIAHQHAPQLTSTVLDKG